MNNIIDLPEQFSAFEELIFCSNHLQKCSIPVVIDDKPIFLVGKGEERPQIWLWGIKDRDTKELVQIVSSNSVEISTGPITVEMGNNVTCIKLNDLIIIEAVKLSDEKAIIKQIDLRTIGFNIIGNANTLSIGTNVIEGNVMVGGQAFVALGKN
ncbi:MAG: hypothetical protein KAJ07_11615 [Planctomycetes bacterium]|nr:hypothetical protein [Planctomycetota bacterium]